MLSLKPFVIAMSYPDCSKRKFVLKGCLQKKKKVFGIKNIMIKMK